MIKKLENSMNFNVRGRIKTGFKAIKAECAPCNKKIVGMKSNGGFVCPDCGGKAQPLDKAKEYTQSTPYFVIPDELKPALGDKPTSLRVIPAYTEMERTIPNSYARFTGTGKIFCSGDGEVAQRYDPEKKATVEVPCSGEDCPDLKAKRCKPSGTFYFTLPDVDVFSAYEVLMHSSQSIGNIISTLNKLRGGPDQPIKRAICTLTLVEKTRKQDNSVYRVLQLHPPQVSLAQLQASGGVAGALGYDAAAVNEPDQGQEPVGHEEPLQEPVRADQEAVGAKPEPTAAEIPSTPPQSDADRAEKGRAMIKEKLKEIIVSPFRERALDAYCIGRFGISFESMRVEKLLILYKDISEDTKAVNDIYDITNRMHAESRAKSVA